MTEHAEPVPHWGAMLTAEGVTFRLWAPDVAWVQLQLEADSSAPGEQTTLVDMHALLEGWWQIACPGIGAGSRYRFRLSSGSTVPGSTVPDPASRFQPQGCHGPSEVIDPAAYVWRETGWSGRPWHETVLYELHVGTFTPEGTYAAAIPKLARLAELGITAIELLPLATFAGQRNWGYDGVLPFAPAPAYGRPEELKALIDAAHQAGLMVFVDVVYNHFGPEGNYLGEYAQAVFTSAHHTPWGAAINYDQGWQAAWVRRYMIDNALYWLTEYRVDGLRLDAVHSMVDTSSPHILIELAAAVQQGPGRSRHVHLVLENDANEARWLSSGMTAQWNDDFHHILHHCLTGESDSYYRDYCADADDNVRPVKLLGRALVEGFAYQGEASAHRDGEPRGETSTALPVTAFVNFLQNHDQVGNRALGERLHQLCTADAYAVATAIQLLTPAPPLLFMGQEWCADSPFLYFCDFDGELKQAVTEGRRREFAQFPAFSDPDLRQSIPDPNAVSTFMRSKLDWSEPAREPHAGWWQFHQQLLTLRRQRIQPLLENPDWSGKWQLHGTRALEVTWTVEKKPQADHNTRHYTLLANLGGELWTPDRVPQGECLARVMDAQLLCGEATTQAVRSRQMTLPPWAALFILSTP